MDLSRRLRRGFPEVIYAKGKTPQQVEAIARLLHERGQPVLATKVPPSMAKQVIRSLPWLRYFPTARILAGPNRARGSPADAGLLRNCAAELHEKRRGRNGRCAEAPACACPPVEAAPGRRAAGAAGRRGGASSSAGRSPVLVVTAGTGDIPVAEEAAVTVEWMGQPVSRLFDVGVAGIHRLLRELRRLRRARVIVVVAGMDGALPSVVSGLVQVPVIAVPTSAGYGASFRGMAPLLTMLNSCSPGVAVVNIGNGFGAGYLAAVIAAQR